MIAVPFQKIDEFLASLSEMDWTLIAFRTTRKARRSWPGGWSIGRRWPGRPAPMWISTDFPPAGFGMPYFVLFRPMNLYDQEVIL